MKRLNNFRQESTSRIIFNFFTADIILYIITFFAAFVRLKIFAVEDYGFLKMAESLVPIATQLCVLGLPYFLLIKLPKITNTADINTIRIYIKKSIILILITVAVAIICSLVLYKANVLPEKYHIPLKFLGIYLVSGPILGIMLNVHIALKKSALFIRFKFYQVIAGAILSISTYLLTRDIVITLIVTAFGAIFLTYLQLFCLMKEMPVKDSSKDIEKVEYSFLAKQAVNFGKWTIPSNFIWNLYALVPLWLAASIGLKEVAYVGFALKMRSVFFVPFTKVSDAILQHISKKQSETNLPTIIKDTKEKQNILMPFFILCLSLFYILFGIGVKIFFAETYINVALYVYIQLSALPFIFLWYLLKNVPASYEKIRLASIPEYLCGVVYILLVFSLFKLFGITGIFVAYTLSHLTTIVFLVLIYKEFNALTLKWSPFLGLIPISVLVFYNPFWLFPFIILLAFLLYSNHGITIKYIDIIKTNLLRFKTQTI